jgi:hypothetical protein
MVQYRAELTNRLYLLQADSFAHWTLLVCLFEICVFHYKEKHLDVRV